MLPMELENNDVYQVSRIIYAFRRIVAFTIFSKSVLIPFLKSDLITNSL